MMKSSKPVLMGENLFQTIFRPVNIGVFCCLSENMKITPLILLSGIVSSPARNTHETRVCIERNTCFLNIGKSHLVKLLHGWNRPAGNESNQMSKAQNTKTEIYTRYELHQKLECGNWRRVQSLRTNDISEAMEQFQKYIQTTRETNRGLRWILPSELTQDSSYRVAKCTVEILDTNP